MRKRKKSGHLTIYKPKQPAYPNAAREGYFLEKAIDIITAIVSGVGFVTAMLFLLALC